MDDIDARIVAFLVRDARASYALIGGEVGLGRLNDSDVGFLLLCHAQDPL